MELGEFLAVIADHAKVDPDFRPSKDARTKRWHASVDGRDFSLIITGTKFLDDITGAHGGGAIDLAMYLWGSPFKATVKRMKSLSLPQ